MYRVSLLFFVILLLPAFVFARVPNDPLISELWYLDQIKAQQAWDVTVGSRDVVVAVLDAGVGIDHPDLAANIWQNPLEIPGNGIDDDGNGYIDDVHGWDFVRNIPDPRPVLLSGDAGSEAHGTLVAGIIGAVGNNGQGITGLNWEVSIMPIRILDEAGSGNSVNAIKAIDYAVANGADVINLSFAGITADPNFGAAIRRAYDAGVVVVAAAGNESAFVNEQAAYPVCYDGEEGYWILGVAASDRADFRADFSNYGSDCVDVSAPGDEIFGLFYGGSDWYRGFWSGTSMAAPLVSGAAALLLAEYPSLTPLDISSILKLAVDPIPLGESLRGHMGAGRLNVFKALSIAGSFVEDDVVSEEPVAPVPPVSSDAFEIDSDSLAVISGNDSVYTLVPGAGRRAFINAQTYFTHFDSFDLISTVSMSDVSAYSLTGLVLPKAGVVLVKIQSDPRVYALEENPADPYAPVLREIANEQVAKVMYGDAWADYVIDIEPTFFTKFARGMRIDSPIAVDRSIMKTRFELAHFISGN